MEYAQQLSLDIPLFLQEMRQHTCAQRIQADTEIAKQCDVQDAPMVIVGIRHQGCDNLEIVLQQALELTAFTRA